MKHYKATDREAAEILLKLMFSTFTKIKAPLSAPNKINVRLEEI